ncbi:class I SAM-dependent methyltransferase [Streptomyces sp. NBC_01235]|uniref:class I SAM-dependent methyltransferase n=1 Tax=Streptomyces sp. NBC_01235 TaxID=2903788 RepID=UPI002E108E65|nr:methyltransferase domain-containing protein [Streptomyces sp. NBC_01235]
MSEGVTDPELLVTRAYGDARHLTARQSLYQWQRPRYDLPGLVAAELADVTGRVLDVGCAYGQYVRRLRKDRPDLEVVGADLSAGILAGLPGPVVVADAQALPFADDAADAVLALHMLYHVPDIPAAIRELARVLKPGGVLVVSTNSGTDKRELDQLWRRAAGDGHAKLSPTARFPLEAAPELLGATFGDVRVRELPGVVEVTDPAPVVAHLASHEAWAGQAGASFAETVRRAERLVRCDIDDNGVFRVHSLAGLLVCRL